MTTMITNDDIDVLCEALEAWENKDATSRMMGDVFSTLLLPENADEALKAKVKKVQHEQTMKLDAERRARKDTSLLLRAKLVGIKRDRDLDALQASASAPFQPDATTTMRR